MAMSLCENVVSLSTDMFRTARVMLGVALTEQHVKVIVKAQFTAPDLTQLNSTSFENVQNSATAGKLFDVQFLQRVGIAESYSSAVYAMMLSVRLSVRPPSHSGVLSRRMKLLTCGFHRQVGQSS